MHINLYDAGIVMYHTYTIYDIITGNQFECTHIINVEVSQALTMDSNFNVELC